VPYTIKMGKFDGNITHKYNSKVISDDEVEDPEISDHEPVRSPVKYPMLRSPLKTVTPRGKLEFKRENIAGI